jgi:hypothetical protein
MLIDRFLPAYAARQSRPAMIVPLIRLALMGPDLIERVARSHLPGQLRVLPCAEWYMDVSATILRPNGAARNAKSEMSG